MDFNGGLLRYGKVVGSGKGAVLLKRLRSIL